MDDKKFERLLKAVRDEVSKGTEKEQPEDVKAALGKAFLQHCQDDINQQERK